MRKIISGGLLVLGLMGLLLSLVGEVTTLGEYKSLPPRSWEKFDPQLVIDTADLASLQRKTDALINQSTLEQEKMLIIYKLVINRFTHGHQAKYNVFSNWFLWLLGQAVPTLSYIRQPDVLVAKGYSSLCSEQAYLLQILAESQGIRTRSVGLYGHVVMEAWYENDWHLYDPDLEVIPVLKNNQILSLDALAKSPELVRKYYEGRGSKKYVQSVVDIISSREDNSFTSYPRLSLFEWKTNVLFFFEKIANCIKWVFPMILLIIGLRLYFIKSKKN